MGDPALVHIAILDMDVALFNVALNNLRLGYWLDLLVLRIIKVSITLLLFSPKFFVVFRSFVPCDGGLFFFFKRFFKVLLVISFDFLIAAVVSVFRIVMAMMPVHSCEVILCNDA